MQTRSSDENLSICLSVCQTRELQMYQILRPQVQVQVQVQVPKCQVRVQVQVLRPQVQVRVQVLKPQVRVQVQVPCVHCKYISSLHYCRCKKILTF